MVTQQAYDQFCNTHLRANLTSMVRTFIISSSTKFSSQLLPVRTQIDFEELERDIDFELDYTINTLNNGTHLIFKGSGDNLEYHGRTTSKHGLLLELAKIANIDVENYRYNANTWYAVSPELFEYLLDNDEMVMLWEGMYIWGTWRRSKNVPINTTSIIKQAFLDMD